MDDPSKSMTDYAKGRRDDDNFWYADTVWTVHYAFNSNLKDLCVKRWVSMLFNKKKVVALLNTLAIDLMLADLYNMYATRVRRSCHNKLKILVHMHLSKMQLSTIHDS